MEDDRFFWGMLTAGVVIDILLIYFLVRWADAQIERWSLAFLIFVGLVAFASFIIRKVK